MFEQKTVAETRRLLRAEKAGGLTGAEAVARRVSNGPNRLKEPERPSLLRRFGAQFMDPLVYVLAAAGIISILLGEAGDAAIIAAVAVLNAAVGVIQEGKAQKALEALKDMTRLQALVRREGRVMEIDAADLVFGDLVLLEAGRQVPADLRLVQSENLKIEESALTGESMAVEKDADFLAKKPLALGDCKNLAYMSTSVTAGRGEGLVTATGMETEIGRIAKLIHEAPRESTPLQKRLGELGTVLSILAVALCAVLFLAAVIQRRDAGEMFLTAISLAVAAVPEGLPAVVTIVLALSVSRMVRVHTIVRRLPSVETLGAVSVVCSDKTGTLTKNRMAVEVWESFGDPEELTRAFVLCNDARAERGAVMGDPTEIALLEYAEVHGAARERGRGDSGTVRTAGGGSIRGEGGASWTAGGGSSRGESLAAAIRSRFPRVGERPFDSERKRMTTVHRQGSRTVSYTKGAPDLVLTGCSHILRGAEVHPLTASERESLKRRIGGLSSRGLRVLGAAKKEGDGRDETGMVFLGLAAMSDPPRAEAAGAVALFRKAGVRTVMITGDHKATAFSIARRLGIADTPAQCMTGEELETLSEGAFRERLSNIRVFARVSSAHKVRIVRALKAAGNIVAMTGDGVNDAPSLKAADVGIAMGLGGTDVAKQAADIVLADDNFATIEKAIEEGRGIYANIKKAVLFLLSSNFGEIMTMFTAILCFLPSPLKASHILWINLITDSLPALALGTDENDGAAMMAEPPRKAGESLFAHGGLSCTCFYGVLIAVVSLTAFLRLPVGMLGAAGEAVNLETLRAALADGAVLSRSQTYAFTVLGLSQLFHAVGMRDVEKSVFAMNHLQNKLMAAAVCVGVVLQLLVTEIPWLAALFQTVTLSGGEWRELLLLASAPMAAHEILVLFNRLSR